MATNPTCNAANRQATTHHLQFADLALGPSVELAISTQDFRQGRGSISALLSVVSVWDGCLGDDAGGPRDRVSCKVTAGSFW